MYELAVSVGAIIFIVILTQLVKDKKLGSKIILCFALIYMASVIYLTTIRGERTGLGGICIRFPFPFYIALKKHRYGRGTNRSVLNLLLFVPFGYLLPHIYAIWNRHNVITVKKARFKWWWDIAIGFMVSLSIEVSQIVFRVGVFELDDLLKNTIGTGVGYILFKILNKKLEKEESFNADD